MAIIGDRLGPSETVYADGEPVATLAGVQATLRTADLSFVLPIVSAGSQQVVAWVPKDVPIGTAEVLLTYAGSTSKAAPVEIVVPLQPPPTLPPALRIVTEGLREGRIKLADRELYFTTLTGSMQKLADPQLDNRFWIHGQTGWVDVTEAVYHGRMRL